MIETKKLLKSFKYAFNGLKIAVKQEQNLRIQIIISILTLLFGLVIGLKAWEFIVIILLIIFIVVLELINTIFERLTDMLKPRIHTYVSVIKDMMAASVLVAAAGSIVIGLIIFLPYLSNLLK